MKDQHEFRKLAKSSARRKTDNNNAMETITTQQHTTMARDKRQAVPLAIQRLTFELVFDEPCRLPDYPGSALRGVLGHSLRELHCVTRQRHCQGCPLLTNCGYVRFFDTPALDGPAHGDHAPHPWALDFDTPTPTRLTAGQRLRFGITLFGDQRQALPWLILALERAGRRGLTRRQTRFSLQSVHAEQITGLDHWQSLDRQALSAVNPLPAIPPAMPARARLYLQTPLRLKRQGSLVKPNELTPNLLLQAVGKRLHDLVTHHEQPPSDWHPPELPTQPLAFDHAALHWEDPARWSSRQQTRMRIGGIAGIIELDLTGIEAWWPALWTAQWTHIGKLTSMGLGQYRITSL